MADLGAIARIHPTFYVARKGDSHWDTQMSIGMVFTPQVPNEPTGHVSGIVKVAGVAVNNARVYLINKTDERVEFFTRSVADGSFEFHDVPIGIEYTVIAYAETGTHNAAIIDKVVAGSA